MVGLKEEEERKNRARLHVGGETRGERNLMKSQKVEKREREKVEVSKIERKLTEESLFSLSLERQREN